MPTVARSYMVEARKQGVSVVLENGEFILADTRDPSNKANRGKDFDVTMAGLLATRAPDKVVVGDGMEVTDTGLKRSKKEKAATGDKAEDGKPAKKAAKKPKAVKRGKGKPPSSFAEKKRREQAARDAEENGEDGEDGDEGEEDGGEKEESSIVRGRYKKEYGKPAHCGDEMALAFAGFVQDEEGGLDLGKLAQVAGANGVDLKRWSHLNNGQKRMNLGNVLRGLIRKGTDVKVGSKTFKGEKVEPKAKPAKKKAQTLKDVAARKVARGAKK